MSQDPTEALERLHYVLDGPWARQAQHAERHLQKLQATNRAAWTTDRSPALPADSLKAALRPHWSRAVHDPREIRLRDSFDEALGTLQLIELGIETGYLAAEAVRAPVLERLQGLLWARPAIDYLRHYDFVAVRFLAARYELALGLPPVQPPAPRPEASIRFATFLGTLTQWYADADIGTSLRFLDDYVQEANEQLYYQQFLRAGGQLDQPNRRFDQLTRGFHKMIIRLNDAFKVAEEDERSYFGLYFAYWLAKLFGQELGPKGYRPGGPNWAELLSLYPRAVLDSGSQRVPVATARQQQTLRRQQEEERAAFPALPAPEHPAPSPDATAATAADLLRSRLGRIRSTWDETRSLIESLTR